MHYESMMNLFVVVVSYNILSYETHKLFKYNCKSE
jgi:hypothetical protein